MRTALDTNIISALWSNEANALSLAQHLRQARLDGAVLLSGVVYAELLAYPRANEDLIHRFAAETGTTIQLSFAEDGWSEAGHRYAKYVARRRKARTQTPKRLLADFLVGAHALIQADRLMPLDVSRYARDFPELSLYDLSSPLAQ